MANVPAPQRKKIATGIAIAAGVVLILLWLWTLGFVAMIVAYAMLHAPPSDVATGADAAAQGADGESAK
jgi:hypothetical protein